MDQFAMTGWTASTLLSCAIEGADIYQTDYMGNRRPIGKTLAAWEELEATTSQYYDKLVELGVIVPPASTEQMLKDMQSTMREMAGVISALSAQVKELNENGYDKRTDGSEPDVPIGQPPRGGGKRPQSAPRDAG